MKKKKINLPLTNVRIIWIDEAEELGESDYNKLRGRVGVNRLLCFNCNREVPNKKFLTKGRCRWCYGKK